MRYNRLYFPLMLLALSGCATAAGEREDLSFDEPPKLIGCSGEPNTLEGDPSEYVYLQFRLDERGRVVPGTVRQRHTPGAGDHPPARAVSAAQERALSCEYQPAVKDGEPVAVQWRETFRIRP